MIVKFMFIQICMEYARRICMHEYHNPNGEDMPKVIWEVCHNTTSLAWKNTPLAASPYAFSISSKTHQHKGDRVGMLWPLKVSSYGTLPFSILLIIKLSVSYQQHTF